MRFNTIPEALEDLRQGKIILVTDDPERENEGDFICAAEFATTENVKFMDPRQRSDLYADVGSLCTEAEVSADGSA